MNLDQLFTDLTSNPLFITFTIIEVAIFIFALYQIYKSYSKTTITKGLGEKIRGYFEKQKSDSVEQKAVLDLGQDKSNNLLSSIIKLISSSEQNEMGIERNDIERLLKYEFEKPQSYVRTAINILPVVGLIGTFAGISIAVYQLSFASDIGEIYQTIAKNLQSLNPFLDGIKLAFYTTILALFLALVLRILNSFSITRSQNAIIDFQNYLSTELTEYLKPAGPAEKIAKSITGFSKRVSRLSGDIEKSLNKIVDNYTKSSENQAKVFDQKINDLNKIQDSIINNVRILWDKISVSLNHTTEQIIKATDNYTEISEISHSNSEKMVSITNQLQQLNSAQIDNTTKIGLAVRKLSEDNEKITRHISEFVAPLEDLRQKFNQTINQVIKLNEPFKETNTQLKESFGTLVQSVNDLQIKNSSLVEKLNVYASSLESNLGTKLDSIVEAESLGQTMMKSLNEVQINLNQSVENLNAYSKNLGEASQIFIKSIDNQLNMLFVNLSSRQDIAINLNNSGNEESRKIEGVLEKQNVIFTDISLALKNINHTMDRLSQSINKPPFFSIKRWFGGNNHKPRKTSIAKIDNKVPSDIDNIRK